MAGEVVSSGAAFTVVVATAVIAYCVVSVVVLW